MHENAMPPEPLDGNAVAGLLQDVFAFETTSATLTCDGCGAAAQIGSIRLYGGEMGAVLRCVRCDTAVLRLVHTPLGLWFDMRGTRSLLIRAAEMHGLSP